MNWKALFHSLIAAAISGAATGGMSAVTGGNFKQVGSAAGIGAAVGVLGLLKSSPLVQPPTAPPPAVAPTAAQALQSVMAESAGPTAVQK